MKSDLSEKIKRSAELIAEADAIIISSGAGMGVDSGLPDFRGPQGFWRAYPMYERLGIQFMDAANPVHFADDPAFGWGFYGHRLQLYRDTKPHDGFEILKKWVMRPGVDHFVLTSNVDGQFQKAGFEEDNIYEVHGSIHHLQCIHPCERNIWENRETVNIDHAQMRAQSIPRCPGCQSVARPNILMFGDYSWDSSRSDLQGERMESFLNRNSGKKIVIVELGAGTAVPTIRMYSERICAAYRAELIRINPREPSVRHLQISLPLGALAALNQIDQQIADCFS